MSSQMLPKYASKLGLTSRSDILTPASEYLLQLERSSKMQQMQLTSSCLAVLALNLAAKRCGISKPASDWCKLAGVRGQKQYANCLKNAEDELGLQEAITVEDVCVKMGCTQFRR